MTVRDLSNILKQFDPDQRVLMEFGISIFEPTVLVLMDEPYYRSYMTDAAYGDVLIAAK